MDDHSDLSAIKAAWDHAGLSSGHAWARCDVCGEEAMVRRSRSGRECFVTPRCRGQMHLPPDRPTPLQALKAGLITLDDIRRNPPPVSATLRRLLLAQRVVADSDEAA